MKRFLIGAIALLMLCVSLDGYAGVTTRPGIVGGTGGFSTYTSAGSDTGWDRTTGQIKQAVGTDKVIFGNSSSTGMLISGRILRSQDEITIDVKGTPADYQATILAEPSLVSYWKMDNTWLDAEGSNNGTASGATFGTAKYGTNSGSFDGNDNVTATSTSIPIAANSRTVEFWAYPTAIDSTYRWVYSNGALDSNQLFAIGISDGNQWVFTNYGESIIGTTVQLNTWIHIAVTYDVSTVKLYENGVLKSSGGFSLATLSSDVYIGSIIDNTSYFYGLIDEMAIYDMALTEETLLNHNHLSSRSHFHVENNTTNFVDLHLDGNIYAGATNETALTPSVADEATGIAYTFDTENTLSIAGAKIAVYKNNGTEKAYVDKDGKVLTPEIIGSTTTTGTLRISSTSHATKGLINIGLSSYDEFLDMFSLYNLTGNRAIVSDASKNIITSATTDTEISYLSGVVSPIQTQLDSKVKGTGVVGYIPKFTNSTTIGNSQITDNGTLVSFNNLSTTGYIKTLGMNVAFRNVSGMSSATVNINDYMMTCHAFTGGTTLNIQSVATIGRGKKYNFLKKDSSLNKCYIAMNGSDKINGFGNLSGLDTQWEAYSVVCDGVSNCYIFGNY